MDAIKLAQLLKDAASAHHTYEATLGHADENWPVWYANFIVGELATKQSVGPRGLDDIYFGGLQ